MPAFFCRAGWQPDVSPTVSPMPPGFDHRHPGGMIENSPAFQRWDRSQRVLSPEGTAEDRSLSRPFGTCRTNRPHPALKRWAIFACPFGTGAKTRLPGRALGSIPSGVGLPVCAASVAAPRKKLIVANPSASALAYSDYYAVFLIASFCCCSQCHPCTLWVK